MRLLSPGALWWLLLAGPIIFFYLLKLRRNRRVVPSTLLWQRAVEEMQVNAPFRRLRRNLLLLLQLAVLMALALALARPALRTTAYGSGSTVIVIDSTASMSARDENDGRTSRLERAKEIAREMISSLSAGARMAVIEASFRSIVRCPLTSDRAALTAGLNDIRGTDTSASLGEALLLAEQLTGSEPEASIVLIGDGGSPVGEAAIDVPLRYIRVGTRSENLGIGSLNSRSLQSGDKQLFASVVNFSPNERTIGMELSLDGRLVDARSLTVVDRASAVFDLLPPQGGLLKLELVDLDDDLASDNVAYAFVPDSRPLRVFVASESRFVLGALAANQQVEAAEDPAKADVIVAEGAAAATLPDSHKPMLLINPPPGPVLAPRGGGRVEKSDVSSDDTPLTIVRAHPVNAYLTYADLHIQGLADYGAAPGLNAIVSAGDIGLIWAGGDGPRRMVVLGFDLASSDFPLKAEFPMLIANSLAWLGERNAGSERAIRTGQPVTLSRESDAEVSLTTPRGARFALTARDGLAVLASASEAGLYEVDGSPQFAASLLSEAESDLTPRDSIATKGGEIRAQSETFEAEREIWSWIALIAAATLGFEWWLYIRRV